VPPFVLTVLKVVFLALLYFFIWRAIRSVMVEVRTAPARARARGETRGHAGNPTRQSKATAGRGGGKAKPPRSVVVTEDGVGKGRSYPLNGQLQIGRAEACQIQLGDTYASQFHAKISQREEAWYVEDLGSTNGTYLNQRRLTSPAEVNAGDRLKIGKTSLEFRR
jgi:pSer/pThr/pTyr-binding forkhead associated (FHA) protein